MRDHPLPEGPFDLAVVGGGINGVGIARDAVMRGHSVVLFEKGDLGSGTSSSTSKMVHGGLRYLEQMRLGLVYESLRERRVQLKIAPHLVRPQEFLLPIYENESRPRWMVRIGLWVYDKLSLGHRLGPSRMLPREAVIDRIPDLLRDHLIGGGAYWDAVMDDARLVIANAVGAMEASRRSGTPFLLRTYTKVVEHRATQPIRLTVEDEALGRSQNILAHKVVYAKGPWSSGDCLAPSKGIHLVLPPFPVKEGMLLQHASDGRVFFAVPWRGFTIIGTTETAFQGNPDSLRPEEEDVRYLVDEVHRLFPELRLSPDDILAVFAGVRPLARSHGWWPFRKEGPGGVSRKHRIVQEADGIYSVFGGKYTTYRAVAKQVVDQVLGNGSSKNGTCSTHRTPLPGGEEGKWEIFRRRLGSVELNTLDESEIQRIYSQYGSRCREILKLCRDEPDLATALCEGHPELRAELAYSIDHEFVLKPADFLCRRSSLRYSRGGGRSSYDAVAALIRERGLPMPDGAGDREEYFAARDWEDRVSGKVPATT